MGGKWMWQGAKGPHGHVDRRHVASPGPPCGPATSLIRGRASTRPLQRYPMSVCFKGQDGAALDPWIHHHTLEELHRLNH